MSELGSGIAAVRKLPVILVPETVPSRAVISESLVLMSVVGGELPD
jgi:hypothetical protein